jgi:hypothetical protein
MTKAFGCALLASIGILAMAQSRSGLQKGDRPVFMSAATLATLCKSWGAINPGGSSSDTVNISIQDIVRGSGCQSYIFGVYDEGLSGLGTRYHPVQSQPDFLKPLIDTFIKRVADHPEEEDLAASTVLHEAEKTVGNAQGVH